MKAKIIPALHKTENALSFVVLRFKLAILHVIYFSVSLWSKLDKKLSVILYL